MSVASFLCLTVSLARLASADDDLTRVNRELRDVNAVASRLAWDEATRTGSVGTSTRGSLSEAYAEWRTAWCRRLVRRGDVSDSRQVYLLCRGPVYDGPEARELTETVGKLRIAYGGNDVCRSNGTCLTRGNTNLERVMSTSRDPETLLRAWIDWRNAVGEPSRTLYEKMVSLLNTGARNNGYNDIGECWREELEVDNLESLVNDLYAQIRPLYTALHAVVRYKLNQFYGSDLVTLDEPIPAHLLGDMWGEDWSSLVDLVVDVPADEDVDESLKRKNYTVRDMVGRAEDFYTSLGFRPMTDEFWAKSKLIRRSDGNESVECHASAVNMFRPSDFRMMLCEDVPSKDFEVVHHEMGHIEYFMEYENQPTIYQDETLWILTCLAALLNLQIFGKCEPSPRLDAANSAFHEAIGNTIMYGVMTPTHLHRLNLVRDADEATGIDIRLLLRQALSKLPRLPYALALDVWRWDVFRGRTPPSRYNQMWWHARRRYGGVKPPVPRTEEFFDPAAKFHVTDNTPYIRYFLSSILEVQLFEALCKGTVYGYARTYDALPIPLHRCDVYGSKDGAEKLREMMSLGRSVHWSEALRLVTGEATYSTRPLLTYYRPLYDWLIQQIEKHRIPVGW